MSDLSTTVADAAEEAAQSKDAVALSLVDDTKEVIMEECFPEEEILDVIIEKDGDIEGGGNSKKYTPTATILG